MQLNMRVCDKEVNGMDKYKKWGKGEAGAHYVS